MWFIKVNNLRIMIIPNTAVYRFSPDLRTWALFSNSESGST